MIDGALSHEMSEIDIQDALSDATGSALEQTPDPTRPTVEPFLGIGSAVQRLNTVKAHIHKVSRQVFGIGHPAAEWEITSATRCSRTVFSKPGLAKLGCLISTACSRRYRPLTANHSCFTRESCWLARADASRAPRGSNARNGCKPAGAMSGG
jgi:hypothetical protein